MIEQLTNPLVLRAGILLFAASLIVVGAARTSLATPQVASFTLKNGMQVVVVEDHRAPVVTHMVWYKVGGADEPRGVSGIAHFLEHLMFKGTDRIPPGQFSKIMARNGGEDNAFTSHDVTAYHQRVAKERLPLVMEMEADRMSNLKLDESEVLTERMVILEERRSRVDNDPSSILQEQMMAALYQSHPYGIPVLGWEHEMRELSRQDALTFYKRFYAPNNAILVVAGDITPDEVGELAEKTYGLIQPNPEVSTRVRPREPRHYAPVRIKLADARAGRPTVQRYYLAPSYSTAKDGDAEALDLLMRVVGSGTTSRLYKKLVMDRRSAASAGAWYGRAGLDSSRIGFYAVASDGVTIEDLEAQVDEVLAEVRADGVTQAELDRARTAMLADYVYASDNQSSLARRFGWALAQGQTLEHIQTWPDRVKLVKVEDLQRVARKYLDEKQSVTGVLSPIDVKTSKDARDANRS